MRSYTRLTPLLLAAVLALAVQGCTPAASEQYTPKPVSLDALIGEIDSREGDVVVVNFWATWCLPCRVEFPDLVQFGKDFEDKGVDVCLCIDRLRD